MIQANRWALVLATGATGTALCLSVLAGWQRGGALAERLAWIAIGVVLVASAHLLPALVRGLPLAVRAVAGALWVACIATACQGHATFFLLAQRHAAEMRAVAVPSVQSAPAGRSLTAVMAERAEVTARLATANTQRCAGHCSALDIRRASLAAKLDALDAEAGDIRRWQAADDWAMTRRDTLAADPVAARLAALLGTTVMRVDLLSSLAFAAVLEGVACLLWTVTLRIQPAVTDAPPVTAPVTGSHPSGSEPVAPLPTGQSLDPDTTQLALDIAAGRVRPTVADIRRWLGCSQARAIALRRQLAALHLAA